MVRTSSLLGKHTPRAVRNARGSLDELNEPDELNEHKEELNDVDRCHYDLR